jgi:UDP-N-acetylglucosamine acyltransferase
VIHPTAVVDRRAELDSSVEIGPHAVVEGSVRIGAGSRVLAHAILTGDTTLGRGNVVHYGAVIGHEPQDVSYAGGATRVVIGDDNVFREYAQVHRGTKPGTETRIGNRGYFMNGSHVAHNCRIADDCVVAGGALLAGYVEMGDRAFVSGNCTVHQFVRIGRLAFLRGISRTSRDVPPFCVMDGTHTVRGLNAVGLRRAGIPREEIRALRDAFRTLFLRRRNLEIALHEVEAGPTSACVAELVAFIRASERGVCFGPRTGTDVDPGE